MAIHFNTSKERLDYVRGKHEEIVPVEVKPVEAEEKQKKESKPKKKAQSKGKKKDGKVQAK